MSCRHVILYTHIEVDKNAFTFRFRKFNRTSENKQNVNSLKSGFSLGTLCYSETYATRYGYNERKVDLHIPPQIVPVTYICVYCASVTYQSQKIYHKAKYFVKPSPGITSFQLLKNEQLPYFGDEFTVAGELAKVSCQLIAYQVTDAISTSVSKSFLKANSEDLDKNFKRTLLQDLKLLHQAKCISDFSLQIEDETYNVHSIILACRSPVFKKMLEVDMLEKSQRCIAINGLSPSTVKKMIEFLYTDNVSLIDSDSVYGLYTAADMYQIEALKKKCSEYLSQHLNKQNVGTALKIAMLYSDSDLLASANRFVLQNEREIISSASWDELIQENPLLVARTWTAITLMKIENESPPVTSSMAASTINQRKVDKIKTANEILTIDKELKKLEEEKYLCDLSIVVGTKTIQVHAAIFAARSPEFKDILEKENLMDPRMVDVSDMDEETVDRMIHFIYTDEVDELNENQAMLLLEAAYRFKLEVLQKKCRAFLRRRLTVSNICSILDVANNCGDDGLKSTVYYFILIHEKDVILSRNWSDLKNRKPTLILETLSNVNRIRLGIKD